MNLKCEATQQQDGQMVGRWLRRILPALLLAQCTAFALPVAAQAVPNRLEAVDVQALSGQQVQFRLRTSGPAPQPLAFTIDKPARISLDLPGVSLALASRRIDVKTGGVDSVVAGEAGGRTRVVLNLDSMLPYETQVDGNTVVITVGAPPSGATTRVAARAAAPEAQPTTAGASAAPAAAAPAETAKPAAATAAPAVDALASACPAIARSGQGLGPAPRLGELYEVSLVAPVGQLELIALGARAPALPAAAQTRLVRVLGVVEVRERQHVLVQISLQRREVAEDDVLALLLQLVRARQLRLLALQQARLEELLELVLLRPRGLHLGGGGLLRVAVQDDFRHGLLEHLLAHVLARAQHQVDHGVQLHVVVLDDRACTCSEVQCSAVRWLGDMGDVGRVCFARA